MRKLSVDDRVTLTGDVPELALHRGESGIVRSIWFSPDDLYEVEFRLTNTVPQRCLLSDRQVQLQEWS